MVGSLTFCVVCIDARYAMFEHERIMQYDI